MSNRIKNRQEVLLESLRSFFRQKIKVRINFLEGSKVNIPNIDSQKSLYTLKVVNLSDLVFLIGLYLDWFKGAEFEDEVEKFALYYCVGVKFQYHRKRLNKEVLSIQDIADICGSEKTGKPNCEHFFSFVFRFRNESLWDREQKSFFDTLEKLIGVIPDIINLPNLLEDTKKEMLRLGIVQDYPIRILEKNFREILSDGEYHSDESVLARRRLQNLKDLILNPNQHLIDGMDFNVRASNSLKGAGIVNVLLLLCYKRGEILKLPDMTEKFVVSIENNLLELYGIKLKT